MDTKFTPGPWSPGCFVKPDSKCKCSYIFSEGYNGSVAQISVDNECFIQHGGNDSPKLIEAIANARLIAAAPDMYEALDPDTLEEIANDLDAVEQDGSIQSLRAIAQIQRAALAKVQP